MGKNFHMKFLTSSYYIFTIKKNQMIGAYLKFTTPSLVDLHLHLH